MSTKTNGGGSRCRAWAVSAGLLAVVAFWAAPIRAQSLVFVEPDDYGVGAVISRAVPGVLLSAEGGSTADREITTIALGLGRSSTGELVFGYHHVDGDAGFTWRDDVVTQAFFVADFDSPTAYVAIDVVRGGGPGETAAPAILSAFDANGDLLETVQTLGGSADFETLLVTRAAADVSSVRVTGVADPVVLDNLRFEREGDLPPPSCEERLPRCEADLVEVSEELEACLAGEPGDADGDGEHDSTDRCPGTAAGQPVDTAGCSLAQFCEAQASGHPFRCFRSDWRNDEPLRPPRDCRAVRTKRAGWACEPR